MMGQGRDFVQMEFNAADEIVKNAVNAQERRNYASQALEIMGKTTATQEDMDQLVVLVQRLSNG